MSVGDLAEFLQGGGRLRNRARRRQVQEADSDEQDNSDGSMDEEDEVQACSSEFSVILIVLGLSVIVFIT